jgi:hypothetical protein
MEYVSELEDVEVGDVVVTSSLDRIYPKGVTIGVVSSVTEGDQLTKNILIRPEVDFRHLEEVLVLLKGPDPAATLGAFSMIPFWRGILALLVAAGGQLLLSRYLPAAARTVDLYTVLVLYYAVTRGAWR